MNKQEFQTKMEIGNYQLRDESRDKVSIEALSFMN